MKYVLRGKIPKAEHVLVIESGSPEVARRAVVGIRKIFPAARYSLLTCWPTPPEQGFESVWRVSDYPSLWEKLRLVFSLRRQRCQVLAILCTGEPILSRWKLLAGLLIPAKILVVNENADFFWLDWTNRKTVRRFWAMRWGVSRELFWATLLRAFVFPFSLLFLLLSVLWLYSRRWRRLLEWKLRAMAAGTPNCASSAELYAETSRREIPPRKILL